MGTVVCCNMISEPEPMGSGAVRGGAPGQDAPVPVVPGEQFGGICAAPKVSVSCFALHRQAL